MTTAQHLALTLALTLCALLATVQAQTARVSTVNVTSDGERVKINAQGDVSEMRIEVTDEQGDMVFQSGAITGQQLDWNMKDTQGERVAAGTYLVTATYHNASGKLRKRVEQVVVAEDEKANTQAAVTPAPNAPQAVINGAGTGTATSGTIAKFTGASTIGNSVIVQSATKNIGIGTTTPPTAKLQVNAAQPPPLAGNGTSAATLLQTSGGKGGNTTGAAAGFQNAGAGASISLLAGNGGNAPEGSRRGNGGSITLQPGSTGTGAGLAGVSGNVLIGPSGVGNVGIGTLSPTSKLHIVSATNDTPPRLQSTGSTSFAAGWDFYHGSAGKGYIGVPGTGVGGPGPGEMLLYGAPGVKTSLWAGGARGITIDTDGRVGIGTPSPSSGRLHVEGSVWAVYARSPDTGVYGITTSNTSIGRGVYGYSTHGKGVYGDSPSGFGVFVASSSGYAGYFSGKVTITGALEVGSCAGCARVQSDQNMKANISAVNPRLVLDRLSAIPIKAWNYKSDEPRVRHIGPMAQDFRAAFNLGVDDKHIDMIDAQGVTMAAIQGLYQQNQELTQEVRTLRTELQQLKRTVKQQRKRSSKKR